MKTHICNTCQKPVEKPYGTIRIGRTPGVICSADCWRRDTNFKRTHEEVSNEEEKKARANISSPSEV